MKRIAVIVLFMSVVLTGMSFTNAAENKNYTYNVGENQTATFVGTYSGKSVAIDSGGQIYVGSITESTIFSNNITNKITGGAIFNPRGYINSVINTIFQENHAKLGGAIYNNKTIASGSIASSQFIKNTATQNGGAIYSAGTLPTIMNSTFDSNLAYGETKGEVGYGGAIYASNDLTITNSNFINNHAYTKGGAIAMKKGDLTIVANNGNTSNFSGNLQNFSKTTQSQNDIYMAGSGQTLKLYAVGSNSTINLAGGIDFAKNLTIHINQPNVEGGKIILGGAVGSASLRPTMYIYGGEMSLISNQVFNNVYAGKVYLKGDTKLGFDVDLSSNVYQNDTFNVSSVTGDSKFILKADSFNIHSGFTSNDESAVLNFIVSGTNLSKYVELQDEQGNKVSIVYQYDEDNPDRAIYKIRQISGGQFIISDPYYIDIISNPLAYAVNYNGEPIETKNTNLATLNLYGGSCVLTLKKNITINSWEDVPVDDGTGVKTLTPRNVQIPDLLIIEGKNKTITSIDNLVGMVIPEEKISQISNTSFNSFDRAVKNDGGAIIMNNVGFQNNTNTIQDEKDDAGNITKINKNGSAVINLNGQINLIGKAKSNKALFFNNTATNGGAIYNEGQMSITYNTFGKNATKKAIFSNIATNGGAIYNLQKDVDDETQESGISSNMTIISSSFVDNLAENGGAIYNKYYDTATQEAVTVNGTFYRNTADMGGAIYNEGYLEAYKSNFGQNKKSAQANIATQNGGAVANVAEGILDSNASNYYMNSAISNGGAIYNTATANINGGNFTSNSSSTGGAIYNSPEGTLHLDQYVEMVLKRGNYVSQTTALNFTSNSSTERGGAIYNEGTIEFNRYDADNLPINMMGNFSKNKAVVANQSKKGVNESNVDDPALYVAPLGGAIYNSSTGKISLTNATFTSNSVSSRVDITTRMYNPPNSLMAQDTILKYVGRGGAIYSESNDDLVILKSTFSKNTAPQSGGAIHNNSADSTIYIVDSDFNSNSSKSVKTTTNYLTVQNGSKTKTRKTVTKENIGDGGAIYAAGKVEINTNETYQTLVDETKFTKNAAANGGAVYAGKTVTGKFATFTNNSATDEGGAVYTKDDVTFTNSTFSKNSSTSNGGAVYGNNIDLRDVSFSNNKASKGDGGAIYATGTVKVNAEEYSSDTKYAGSTFSSNSAVNGGAIYSTSSTLIKNTSFLSNKASEDGGAIYTCLPDGHDHEMHLIDTSFTGNSAKRGGAVYASPYSKTFIVAYDKDINITNNKASNIGGAIYIDFGAEVNMIAYRKDITISGNKMSGSHTLTTGRTVRGGSNAIYLNNSTLNVDAYTVHSAGQAERKTTIKITDNIYGTGNAYLNKYGDGNLIISGLIDGLTISDDSGHSTHLLPGEEGGKILDDLIHGTEIKITTNEGNITGSSIDMGSSLLNIANGNIGKLSLKSLVVNNDVANVAIDMDLKNGTSDKITAENKEGGEVNVSSVNLVSDSKTPVTIKVGEDSEVTSVSATNAETKEATYKLKSRLGAGGMLETVAYGQKAKPCALAAPVAAQLGGYLTQINSYDQAFMNMDMNMTKTLEERKAEMSARTASLPMENGKWKMENYADEKLAYSPQFSNGINQSGKGLWARPYATFERVNLSGGPKVGSIGYGTFFGGDADLKQLRNGWSRQFSAYIGYNGSTQDYDRQSIDQNGGTIGVTEVWYKNNFFTGLTVNVSGNSAMAQTDLGHENFPMIMAGVASKTGYNWELKNGKFVIQPSILLSYSFVHTFSHKNGIGHRVSSSPLHAIQVAPGIKFIANLPKGWQPYLGINMRWNIMDKTHFSLPDVSIPDMSIRPYVEYGVGLQRKWGERFTGYGQAMIRNGGRNGVMLSVGFKWAIGK